MKTRGEFNEMNSMAEPLAGQTRTLVLITGMATTLMIWTSLADPFNLPKMAVLVIGGAWICALLGVEIFHRRLRRFSLGQLAIVGFVLGMLIAASMTDVKYISFFGAVGRNDGAISYFFLAVLALASMMSFTYANLSNFRFWFLLTGAVLAGYGLLQIFGHDPVKWNSLYNPVFGTLGNPDFFSALLATTALATLWFILSEKMRWHQVGAGVLLLIELFVVKRSGSFQGLVAFAVGFVIMMISKVWQFSKKSGIVALVVTCVGSIPIFLGLIDRGPLSAHIYRASLRNRIDYWNAALSMFKAHPLFGVGLDRFGDNYPQYARHFQVVQGQMTDNAHSVFLQLLATGGLVVILPYLFLLGVIAISAVRGIKAASGQRKNDIVALFSIWFAFLLISSISVDNLGVAVWFWIAGGVLYGVVKSETLGRESNDSGKGKRQKYSKNRTSDSSSALAPIVSFVLVVTAFWLVVPAWKGSSMLYTLQGYRGGLNHVQYAQFLNRIARAQPSNSQVLATLGGTAVQFSEFDLGIHFAKMAIDKNPRSNSGFQVAAVGYESEKKYKLAIPFRIRLLTLDPWNTANMVILVKDYIQVKDMVNASAISARINQLYPNSADAKAAATLIKG